MNCQVSSMAWRKDDLRFMILARRGFGCKPRLFPSRVLHTSAVSVKGTTYSGIFRQGYYILQLFPSRALQLRLFLSKVLQTPAVSVSGTSFSQPRVAEKINHASSVILNLKLNLYSESKSPSMALNVSPGTVWRPLVCVRLAHTFS